MSQSKLALSVEQAQRELKLLHESSDQFAFLCKLAYTSVEPKAYIEIFHKYLDDQDLELRRIALNALLRVIGVRENRCLCTMYQIIDNLENYEFEGIDLLNEAISCLGDYYSGTQNLDALRKLDSHLIRENCPSTIKAAAFCSMMEIYFGYNIENLVKKNNGVLIVSFENIEMPRFDGEMKEIRSHIYSSIPK